MGSEPLGKVFTCSQPNMLEEIAGQLLAPPKGTFEQLLYRQQYRKNRKEKEVSL